MAAVTKDRHTHTHKNGVFYTVFSGGLRVGEEIRWDLPDIWGLMTPSPILDTLLLKGQLFSNV